MSLSHSLALTASVTSSMLDAAIQRQWFVSLRCFQATRRRQQVVLGASTANRSSVFLAAIGQRAPLLTQDFATLRTKLVRLGGRSLTRNTNNTRAHWLFFFSNSLCDDFFLPLSQNFQSFRNLMSMSIGTHSSPQMPPILLSILISVTFFTGGSHTYSKYAD